MSSPPPEDKKSRTRVLYISPMRALAFDVEKNLRAPLAGIALAAERLGEGIFVPTVAMRTGDTASRDRQKLIRTPPDLLITTPESLYLMLTSSAAETLASVETVIIDEIHALAPTKRGAHLSLSMERLEEIAKRPPQRIGLSATQRPLEEVARFLGGYAGPNQPRPVTIVDAGIRKPLQVDVVVPVEDMSDLSSAAATESGPSSDLLAGVTGERAAHRDVPRFGPASTPASSIRCSSTVRPSSSATGAARPSGWRPSSTNWPRSGASASTRRRGCARRAIW